MNRAIRTLVLPLAALAGCASWPSGDVAIQTDGRGLFVAAGRETASSSGVLVAQHEAAEEAREYCEDRQRRVLLLGPLVDQDPKSDKVVVFVRFRCTPPTLVGEARP